jgi:hypothetical protein
VLFNAAGIALAAALPQFFLIPYVVIMGTYFAACIATGIGKGRAGPIVAVGIPLTHVVYGIGFLKGLASELEN